MVVDGWKEAKDSSPAEVYTSNVVLKDVFINQNDEIGTAENMVLRTSSYFTGHFSSSNLLETKQNGMKKSGICYSTITNSSAHGQSINNCDSSESQEILDDDNFNPKNLEVIDMIDSEKEDGILWNYFEKNILASFTFWEPDMMLEETLQHIMNTSQNFVQVYLQQHFYLTNDAIIKPNLKFQAMKTLNNGEWLDDEVINFYH
jgi:hypothetical protein